MDASFLYMVVADEPMPSLAENTNGVKQAFSTSLTLSS